MKRSYARAIWKSLREYALWQPGSFVQIGDYGVIKEGCFNRIGNISDLVGTANLDEEEFTLDHLTIKSENAHEHKAGLVSIAKLVVEFKNKFGVFLITKGIKVNTVTNLQQLAGRLAITEQWNRSWFLVTALRSADEFALIISKGHKASLEADAKDLEEFLSGNIQLSSSIKFEGDLALKQFGKKASISVGLHRLRRKGDSFRHLERVPSEADEFALAPYFEEVQLNEEGDDEGGK